MNVVDIIFIALGSILALTGLASLITGQMYDLGSSMSEYTDESLARFARPCGFAKLLLGSGLIVSHLVNTHLFSIGRLNMTIGLTTMVSSVLIAIVVYMVAAKGLVKKQNS